MAWPKLLKFMSLWEKESPGAGKHFMGKIGRIPPGVVLVEGTKVMIFKNRKMASPASPTHYGVTPAPEGKDPEDPDW